MLFRFNNSHCGYNSRNQRCPPKSLSCDFDWAYSVQYIWFLLLNKYDEAMERNRLVEWSGKGTYMKCLKVLQWSASGAPDMRKSTPAGVPRITPEAVLGHSHGALLGHSREVLHLFTVPGNGAYVPGLSRIMIPALPAIHVTHGNDLSEDTCQGAASCTPSLPEAEKCLPRKGSSNGNSSCPDVWTTSLRTIRDQNCEHEKIVKGRVEWKKRSPPDDGTTPVWACITSQTRPKERLGKKIRFIRLFKLRAKLRPISAGTRLNSNASNDRSFAFTPAWDATDSLGASNGSPLNVSSTGWSGVSPSTIASAAALQINGYKSFVKAGTCWQPLRESAVVPLTRTTTLGWEAR
ncbi:hypothetical protein C8F04DRAFT_1228118 [Mycena alexandri]|uniref:Uncharacterized protein n=1 Tax=Mycena alexandri TaxID=1745969 RepID=A0AAD6XE69_9AGAR|nr:hypothetical protein C8F04DRAFT_1228118 [Mycena alexandri]